MRNPVHSKKTRLLSGLKTNYSLNTPNDKTIKAKQNINKASLPKDWEQHHKNLGVNYTTSAPQC